MLVFPYIKMFTKLTKATMYFCILVSILALKTDQVEYNFMIHIHTAKIRAPKARKNDDKWKQTLPSKNTPSNSEDILIITLHLLNKSEQDWRSYPTLFEHGGQPVKY